MYRLSKNSALCFLFLTALLWAIEHWIIQAHTLPIDIGDTAGQLAARETKRATLRMIINLVIGVGLVFSIRTRIIHLLFVIDTTISIALVSFFNYYHEPLTWTIFSNQITEGAAVSSSVFALLEPFQFGLLLSSLCLRSCLIEKARVSDLSQKLLNRVSRTVIVVYALVVLPFAITLRPLSTIRAWHSFSYKASLYGYSHTWAAEMWFFDKQFLLTKASEQASIKSNKLAALSLAKPNPQKISIIQIESLDFNVVSLQVDRRPVMPFLANETRKGVISPIVPIHKTGSSDADFTLLMTSLPNGIVAPYKVPGFRYKPSLISLAQENGFKCVAYHGNRGTFFNRRTAFREMGFDEYYFLEDLSEFKNEMSRWGIPDDTILSLAAKKNRESKSKLLSLVITLSTHHPFRFIPPKKQALFPQPTTIQERYFNNMQYIDRQLANHFDNLDDGTLLFLYGDHTSNLEYPPTGSQQNERDHLVPFIILHKGRQLNSLQMQISTLSDSPFSFLDVAVYIRRHLTSPPFSQ